MDRLHRQPQRDIRMGRDCGSCQRSDPGFEKRNSMDRLVCSELEDTASAHMTENGHVRHRMLELVLRMAARRVRSVTSAA